MGANRSLLGGLESDIAEGRITAPLPEGEKREPTKLELALEAANASPGVEAALGRTSEPKREWSQLQRAIFADAASGDGHTVVEARAGTGKTTTIVEALKHIPRSDQQRTTLVAFNKSIATELGQRAPAGVRVSTMHALGFSAVKHELGRVDVEPTKARRLLSQPGVFTNRTSKQKAAARKLASLAKANLLPRARLDSPIAYGELRRLLDRFWTADFDAEEEYGQVVEMALWLLAQHRDVAGTGGKIDFDDMCWLPAVLNLSMYRSERLFVDEAQDLNPNQHWLVEHAVSRSGRLCAVGDTFQAIYQFRGAAEGSMGQLKDAFGAKELGLSITYRCPRKVAEVVKPFVPDFEAAEGTPDGVVADATVEKMLKDARPGDFILSRSNAPLIGFCLQLLREGRRATVLGRSFGESLMSLIEKSGASSVEELEAYVSAWCDRESERLLRRDPEGDVGHLQDRRDCVLAVADGAASLDEVLERADRLFADGDPLDQVCFSTVHKAKGLERSRVWMIRSTFLRGQSQAEKNIFYVACTRARAELYFVRD